MSVSICVNVNVYSQNYGFHVLMLILAFLILVLIFKYLLDSHSFGKHVWPFFLIKEAIFTVPDCVYYALCN